MMSSVDDNDCRDGKTDDSDIKNIEAIFVMTSALMLEGEKKITRKQSKVYRNHKPSITAIKRPDYNDNKALANCAKIINKVA